MRFSSESVESPGCPALTGSNILRKLGQGLLRQGTDVVPREGDLQRLALEPLAPASRAEATGHIA